MELDNSRSQFFFLIKLKQHLPDVNFSEKSAFYRVKSSEEEMTVTRTPHEYAEHVREMVEVYGEFSLEIKELLAQGNKVYVRWKQVGTHVGEVDGYSPTGLPVIEIASAVYRIEGEKIKEYWIQIDRLGINNQLERNKQL